MDSVLKCERHGGKEIYSGSFCVIKKENGNNNSVSLCGVHSNPTIPFNCDVRSRFVKLHGPVNMATTRFYGIDTEL